MTSSDDARAVEFALGRSLECRRCGAIVAIPSDFDSFDSTSQLGDCFVSELDHLIWHKVACGNRIIFVPQKRKS